MREFNIIRDPNDCGNLYYRSKVVFEPGVTVLVGCNGCGKTTLIRQIKRLLEKDDIPYVAYDNLHDGGSNARQRAGFYGDVDFMATSMCSSEGENIVLNMGNMARSMGALTKKHPDAKELWFLFDAVDSGLSIDNVLDIKEYLFKTVFEHNKDKDIYIIISANAYEMCRGEKCFDTWLCKYIDINSYDEYRDFVIKSRERKDKREDSFAKKRKKRGNR
jgi:energy-coupling factor transporter ATP-binding protein EcfA2